MDALNRINSICFTGHRYIREDFDEVRFKKIVYASIIKGFDTFICGGALGFDTYAAEEILKMKKNFPHIKLHLYLPCNNQNSHWDLADRVKYNKIIRLADYVDMPDIPYYDGCMRARNYKMVDNSSVCFCYLNNDARSCTAQTVRYAFKQGLAVFNVSSDPESVFLYIKEKYDSRHG